MKLKIKTAEDFKKENIARKKKENEMQAILDDIELRIDVSVKAENQTLVIREFGLYSDNEIVSPDYLETIFDTLVAAGYEINLNEERNLIINLEKIYE